MINVYDYYITDEEYAIAAQNGIKKDTVYARVRRLGWDKQRAITEPIKEQRNTKKWIKIAEDNGISYTTFASRIYVLGWDLEKAATTKDGKSKYPQWVFNNLLKNGIKYDTFVSRVTKLNWSIERACTEKTCSLEESTRRGRAKQKELNIGPYSLKYNKLFESKKGGMTY